MIFPEALSDLATYELISEITNVPILAIQLNLKPLIFPRGTTKREGKSCTYPYQPFEP